MAWGVMFVGGIVDYWFIGLVLVVGCGGWVVFRLCWVTVVGIGDWWYSILLLVGCFDFGGWFSCLSAGWWVVGCWWVLGCTCCMGFLVYLDLVSLWVWCNTDLLRSAWFGVFLWLWVCVCGKVWFYCIVGRGGGWCWVWVLFSGLGVASGGC